MASGTCRDCYHYNRLGAGCATGPTVINPNESETCRLDPSQFKPKSVDKSESRGPEGFPQAWHLTGQKPKEPPKPSKAAKAKGERVSFTTKSGEKVAFRKSTAKKGGKKK